jgi:serine/threonine protein kinase
LEQKRDDAAAARSAKPIAHVGEIIAGKFRVERILGEGGMGVVVAAKHLQLDERVALKFLLPDAMKNPETVARFAQEARAAVKLKSEHVARVLDVGIRDDGTPYMVMEYLQGKDLGQLLDEDGPQTIESAAELIIQACEGLAEAHARGIIHRDIKPENLFLVEHGEGWRILKILDFGISKAALTGSALTADTSNIRTQHIMGSPCYMSPEQLRSTQSVDHRADLWSLGAVLFELLTGQPVFDPERPLTELVARVLEHPAPRLCEVVPAAPARLDAVVARCLERDVTKRYQNAAELAIALMPFAHKRVRATVERATHVTRAAGLADGRLIVPASTFPPPQGGLPGTDLTLPTITGPFTDRMPRVPFDLTSPAALGKYRLIASLGRGGMADVFLALARGPLGFNKLIVIKKLRQGLAEEAGFRAMFVDEARLAARLNHPNVVQTYEVGEHASAYFIAMEYLEGQPLNVVVREAKRNAIRLDPLFSARIVADALAGLHYAHELRDYDGTPLSIIHRDVSPHNVFVTYEGQVKLVDFGIAKAAFSSSQTEVGVLKGKVAYMAPEQAMGEVIDRRADIFSMGVVLWELLADRRLMPAESAPAVIHRLLTEPIPSVSDLVTDVEPELAAIVGRALDKKRSKRFQTAKEMRDALEACLGRHEQAPREDAIGEHVQTMFALAREQVRQEIHACLDGVSKGDQPQEIVSLALHPRRPGPSDSWGHSRPDGTGSGGSRRRRAHAIDVSDSVAPPDPAEPVEDTGPLSFRPDQSQGTVFDGTLATKPPSKRHRSLPWVALVLAAGGASAAFLLARGHGRGQAVAGQGSSPAAVIMPQTVPSSNVNPPLSAEGDTQGSVDAGGLDIEGGNSPAPSASAVVARPPPVVFAPKHAPASPSASSSPPVPNKGRTPEPDLDIRMHR